MTEHHAEYSPSRLPRIIACNASVLLCREVEQLETTTYAQEGIMLHSAIAHNIICNTLHNSKYANLEIEHNRAIQDCMDYVIELRDSMALVNNGQFTEEIENQVTLKNFGLPEVYGTSDYSIENPTIIHVVDWKFGKGVPVYAKDNDQLYPYIIGKIKTIERLSQLEEIWIHVVQPRINNFSKVKLSKDDIIKWIAKVKSIILEVNIGNPKYNVTEYCKWCDGKLKCNARYNKQQELASKVFAIHAAPINKVFIDRIADFLSEVKLLEIYIKEIKIFAANELNKGRQVPGFKLIKGRSSRHWVSDEKAIKFLENLNYELDEIYESKLISLPKAEKLIGRKQTKTDEFKNLIIKSEGKNQMVTESDKRPSINNSAETVFAKFT